MSFLDEHFHLKCSKLLNSLIYQEELREVIRKINEMSQEATPPLLLDRTDSTRNLNELLTSEFLREVYSERDESLRMTQGVDQALKKCGCFDASDISSVTGNLPTNTNYTNFKSQLETNRFF